MKAGSLCLIILTLTLSQVAAQLTYKELKVQYDSPWVFKNLKLIPIRFKPSGDGLSIPSGAGNPKIISFADAIDRRKVKVQEMQSEMGADLNVLQVTNHSRQQVLVQNGDILEGGKQDRMVGETKIIEPGTTDYVQVYCVEKRRWSDKAKDFRSAGVANREVQKAMNTTRRQADVWKEIDRQFKAKSKNSETWSYLELYSDSVITDTSYINYFTGKFLESDSSLAGFVFISGNQILSTEIFSSYSLLEVAFPNMLASYVQSAVMHGDKPVVKNPPVKLLMDKVLKGEEEQKLYVTAHGELHKNNTKVIHVVAYPDEEVNAVK